MKSIHQQYIHQRERERERKKEREEGGGGGRKSAKVVAAELTAQNFSRQVGG